MMVADTDVLVDFLRGKGDGARRIEIELRSGSLATTAVTAFELRSGARTPGQRRSVETLLAALTILPLGDAEAHAAAEIRKEVESRGLPIGMADYLIAGICLAADAVLITRNHRHFERVPGLKVGGRLPPS